MKIFASSPRFHIGARSCVCRRTELATMLYVEITDDHEQIKETEPEDIH